jgi:outer membrane protein OmpA-like peptidoglycan-associated protein
MKKILSCKKNHEGGVKMQAITAKRVFMIIMAVFSISFLVGCAGMERSNRAGWFFVYPAPLVNADRALDDARKFGKDKECPEEFNALKDMVDEAWKVYRSCDTQGAINMANEATAKIKALCPRKPVAEVKPEPKPVPPPPAPKPEPTPPPPPPSPAARVIDRLTIHVNFDFDKSNIRKAEEAELNKAVDFVRKYPDADIKLEGHTDSIGTEDYNHKLSHKRAEAVMQYLIDKGGVDKARISAEGFGESRPIAPNKTEKGKDNPKGRAENRRVEVLIISE